MKISLINYLAVPLTLFAIACDNDSDSGDVESVAPPPIPLSDADYIDNLVPHHEMALQMSDAVIARGADPAVREMAQEMKAMQAEEIAMLREIRQRVAGSDRIAAMRDPHSELDLEQINSAASGPAADVAFLENMIPHHAGAVSLSHRALDQLSDPELIEMANMTIVMQTREMNEMLDMLGR
jgi:uncharacterized protein (DUF305 family)